jgi:hypothetical protein
LSHTVQHPSDLSNTIPSPQSKYTHDDTVEAIRELRDEYLPVCKSTIQKPEPPYMSPGDDQYIVKRILSHKVNRPKGRKKEITQYLVKWEGYPDEENCLVNELHEDLVKAYTATAKKLLTKRSVRLGRGKKSATQYLVQWGGYPNDQSIWINEEIIYKDLIEAYRRVTTTA